MSASLRTTPSRVRHDASYDADVSGLQERQSAGGPVRLLTYVQGPLDAKHRGARNRCQLNRRSESDGLVGLR
jgi:hypothetical protein